MDGPSHEDNDSVDGLKQYQLLDHPYPMAVVVSSFMFVLSAKVNFSYNRYWEACQALHNMHAKWLDVGSTMAAFHMQSKEFDKIRPPSFGDHQNTDGNSVLKRNVGESYAEMKVMNREETDLTKASTFISEESSQVRRRTGTSNFGRFLNPKHKNKHGATHVSEMTEISSVVSIHASPSPHEGLPYPEYKSRSYGKGGPTENGSTSSTDIPQSQEALPTLFLQEAAHLVSLLSAVALATLRCDSEDMDALTVEFIPGHRWPNYNSENDPDMLKYGHSKNGFLRTLQFMLDISGTQYQRSAYNAARPFPVIGGVSDREALFLQRARGASAKTALVFHWLQEFLIREQLHGSLGNVAPPIVSRIPQYLSDGHMWYNSARKMSYVPFPFPHAQMATMFVLASVVLMPTLMLSKTELWFGLVLNFLTVLLFAGLNELSKELEYPFRSMPNDLPLNLFQAHFNESIVTMFAGFHPDAWWEIDGDA